MQSHGFGQYQAHQLWWNFIITHQDVDSHPLKNSNHWKMNFHHHQSHQFFAIAVVVVVVVVVVVSAAGAVVVDHLELKY